MTADVILQRIERILPVYERSLVGGPELRAFVEEFRKFLDGKINDRKMAEAAQPVIALAKEDPWRERLAGRFMEMERLQVIRLLFLASAELAAMRYAKAAEAANLANAYNQELAG